MCSRRHVYFEFANYKFVRNWSLIIIPMRRSLGYLSRHSRSLKATRPASGPIVASQSHSRRRTIEYLFVTSCSMDECAEEKRTEKNLIVRSSISEAKTTHNKRLRSTFRIEAIQTRSIARPLCDSRASCFIYQTVSQYSDENPLTGTSNV